MSSSEWISLAAVLVSGLVALGTIASSFWRERFRYRAEAERERFVELRDAYLALGEVNSRVVSIAKLAAATRRSFLDSFLAALAGSQPENATGSALTRANALIEDGRHRRHTIRMFGASTAVCAAADALRARMEPLIYESPNPENTAQLDDLLETYYVACSDHLDQLRPAG